MTSSKGSADSPRPASGGDGEARAGSKLGRALAVHREQVAEVLAGGDPDEIKRLYRDLGGLIDDAVGEDVESVPALSYPESLPAVVALAGDLSGLVLDAGCGPNPSFSIALGRWPARRMIGLDISPGIVKLAALRCRKENVPFHGVVGDVEAIPFRDGVFDGCVCEDTIEHLPDDETGVAELARVIRHRGRLLLGTPNRRRLDVLLAKLKNRLRGKRLPRSAYYAATSHLREYTWRGLSRKVSGDFLISRKATVGWSGGFKAKLASAAVSVWPFREWGKMLLLDLRRR